MMLEITCPNCGSKDLKLEGGYFVCAFCGSRYAMSSVDPDIVHKIDRLEDEMFDELDAKDYENCLITAKKVLVLNPRHAYAWALIMMSEIGKAWGDYDWDIPVIVEAMENAVRYAAPEEWADISAGVMNHINYHKRDILKWKPEAADRLAAVEEYIRSNRERGLK